MSAILALWPNAVVSHAVTPESPYFVIPKVHKADDARWFDMTTATRHLECSTSRSAHTLWRRRVGSSIHEERNASQCECLPHQYRMPHDNATTRTPPPKGVFVSNTTFPMAVIR